MKIDLSRRRPRPSLQFASAYTDTNCSSIWLGTLGRGAACRSWTTDTCRTPCLFEERKMKRKCDFQKVGKEDDGLTPESAMCRADERKGMKSRKSSVHIGNVAETFRQWKLKMFRTIERASAVASCHENGLRLLCGKSRSQGARARASETILAVCPESRASRHGRCRTERFNSKGTKITSETSIHSCRRGANLDIVGNPRLERRRLSFEMHARSRLQ